MVADNSTVLHKAMHTISWICSARVDCVLALSDGFPAARAVGYNICALRLLCTNYSSCTQATPHQPLAAAMSCWLHVLQEAAAAKSKAEEAAALLFAKKKSTAQERKVKKDQKDEAERHIAAQEALVGRTGCRFFS
jgi:hypothetical protein